jgi:hypothetical protein
MRSKTKQLFLIEHGFRETLVVDSRAAGGDQNRVEASKMIETNNPSPFFVSEKCCISHT